ncbi:MAG: S8 family peptidase [Methylococcus sp.]
MFVRKKLLVGSLAAAFGLVSTVYVSETHAKTVEINKKIFNLAEPGDYEPGQVVVRLSKGVGGPAAQAIAARLNGKITKTIPKRGYVLLEVPANQDLSAAVAAARRTPGVETAFKNTRFSVALPATNSAAGLGKQDAILNEALGTTGVSEVKAQVYTPGSNQWHLTQINFGSAGSVPVSAPLVAVIDTGVDYNNPDLVGRVDLVNGYDFVDGDNNPMDENGHGTHVAGLIAASGQVNAVGVSPTSQVLPIRVLDEEGSGTWFDVMAGIDYALTVPNVKIINLSLVGYSTPDSPDYQEMEAAISRIRAAGELPVVSAGNDANILLYYYPQVEQIDWKPIPAWYPASFTVAASNMAYNRSSFSNYNMPLLLGNPTPLVFVDIAAPGESILSTMVDYQYQKLSGTSMSAAIVSGVAARVWAAFGSLTAGQVESRIISNGLALNMVDGFPPVTVGSTTTTTRLVNLMRSLNRTTTGFSGSVFNGLTGAPVPDVDVTIFNPANPAQTFTGRTLPSGQFSVTGLPSSATTTNWTISFTKAGFNAPNLTGQRITANNVRIIPKTVFMNTNQPEGQMSVLIDWTSLAFGAEEAYYAYPSKPSWLPYNWNQTAGLFAAPYVKNDSTQQVVGVKNPGSVSQSPFMRLVNNPLLANMPATAFVIKPQAGNTYSIYMQLDNVKGEVNEWGSYKNLTYTEGGKNYTLSNQQLRAVFYVGGIINPKATLWGNNATGTGNFWHIANINSGGGIITVNQLRNTAP